VNPHWGKDSSYNVHSVSVIKVWLISISQSARAHPVPESINVWFFAHRFCDWVLGSIEFIARTIDRPRAVTGEHLIAQVRALHKPIWLVAFIDPASYTSFRVLHHYQYPCCLSSPSQWYGSEGRGGRPQAPAIGMS
jgi:hypothetical protein